MDFATIGRIGSFAKQKNLLFAANYKLKTGQRIVDANGNLSFAKSSMFDSVNQAQKKTVSEVDKARIASIKQKLMSGKKLSNEEMAYLREKDEKLYKKAKHADEAREELKAALRSAKTKQEARQAVTQAMLKASAEATAEIAAMKAGAGGGGGAGGDINLGELPSGAENISAENIDTGNFEAENVNAETAGAENVNAENSAAQNDNSIAQDENKNSLLDNDEQGEFGLPDILEKFIMTIRALEDEWVQFTKSDRYKNMPEFNADDAALPKTIEVPNSITVAAVEAYKKSMGYRSAV